MPRLGFLRRTLAIPDERHRLRDADFVEQVLDEGVFENDMPGRFTNGYGFVPEGVEVFFAWYGFSKIGLYSAESITIGIQKALHDLAENDTETYTAALDLIVRTADEPSILGMAVHLLYIGRKEKGNPTPVPPDEVEPQR